MTIRPRKQFAQHWLRNDAILNTICQAAKIKSGDRLLEIGPGTGLLTEKLLGLPGVVLSVEIDRDLVKSLVKKFGHRENFLLLEGDFLELDIAELTKDFPNFQNPNKVVANIPYNITGPILLKLLGNIAQPAQQYESIVLLMQKEVAERIIAKPGSKAYGALSVKIQYLADGEFICDVPAKAFVPPPKVDSAVIKLTPRPPQFVVSDPSKLESLIKQGFASKRKMLKNNLKGVIEPDDLTTLLTELAINPLCRAEDLSVAQWVELTNRLFV